MAPAETDLPAAARLLRLLGFFQLSLHFVDDPARLLDDPVEVEEAHDHEGESSLAVLTDGLWPDAGLDRSGGVDHVLDIGVNLFEPTEGLIPEGDLRGRGLWSRGLAKGRPPSPVTGVPRGLAALVALEAQTATSPLRYRLAMAPHTEDRLRSLHI